MSTAAFLLRDRRAQLLLAACAAALVAAAIWLVPARAAITGVQSGGRLTVTQTGTTSSLFKLAGLVPGDVATAEVTLGNDGARGGDLALVTEDLTDHLGPGAAPLSAALALTVEDVSSGAPEPVFAGRLASWAAGGSAAWERWARGRSASRSRCPTAASRPRRSPATTRSWARASRSRSAGG